MISLSGWETRHQTYAEGLQSADLYLYAFGKENTLKFFLG